MNNWKISTCRNASEDSIGYYKTKVALVNNNISGHFLLAFFYSSDWEHQQEIINVDYEHNQDIKYGENPFPRMCNKNPGINMTGNRQVSKSQMLSLNWIQKSTQKRKFHLCVLISKNDYKVIL